MSLSLTLPEQLNDGDTLNPAADASGRTGNYVCIARAQRAYVRFKIKQGNAATVALSLSKATAVAGTGATACTANHRIWANENAASTSVLTAQTAGTSYTTSAATADKVVWFEVDPGSEGATYTAIAAVTGASNAANITEASVFIIPKTDAATLANAMVD